MIIRVSLDKIDRWLIAYVLPVVVTDGIQWMLLETGLAVCIVNLPILYGGFRLKSIGNLINRARSFIPFIEASKTEQSVLHASPGHRTRIVMRSDIHSSDIQMESSISHFEAHAKRGESIGPLEEGLIHVTRTIDLN